MSQPFTGVRVIDCTHVLAGPFATYQLAVLGADVIKIDDPNELDTCRVAGTEPDLIERGMGTTFLCQGSNKRSIALDLKDKADRETLLRLAKTADVFVENYRPGALDDLGLGYRDLAAVNDQLIYVSMSAFGAKGEKRGRRAYDHVVQAASGLMAQNGTPEVNPIKAGAPMVDYATGICGAFAISAALFQRTHTGRGQWVDMAMNDVGLLLMSLQITEYSITGRHPEPAGNAAFYATNGAYQTKDGMIVLGAQNRRQRLRFWNLLGLADVLEMPNYDRPDLNADAEAEILESSLLTRTAQEWEDYLQAGGVPAARVRPLREALADPQLQSRRIVAEQTTEGVERPFLVPVSAFDLEHGGPRLVSPPPTVGQHSAEILAELDRADRVRT